MSIVESLKTHSLRCKRTLTILSLLYLLFTFSSCTNVTHEEKLQNELTKLDEMVESSSKYDIQKQHTIDSIKSILKATPSEPTKQRWQILTDLGNELKKFSSDSAVVYHTMAQEVAQLMDNDSLYTLSSINRANSLATAGIFSAAKTAMDEIDTVGMSKVLKIKYALAGLNIYSYLSSYVNGHEQTYPEINEGLQSFTNYILKEMDHDDPLWRLLTNIKLYENGKYDQAEIQLKNMLSELPKSSNFYGKAAFTLAQVYRNRGEDNLYARYLALAAQSDLESTVREGLALPTLAEWLYANGDNKRAYNYINLSMRDASAGNARMRTAMIADAITMIDDAYKYQIEKSRLMVTIFFIFTIGLLIFAGEMLQLLAKRKQRISDDQHKLSQLTRLQDSYIGHFIELTAYYSDKLMSMSRTVERKISAGQSDDLLKMIKSGKLSEDKSENFYIHFDKVFLDLYPDFVERINLLLKPESQINWNEGEPLTPELRIYALVRLGIQESVKISKILHYSPATIYTYRNKMRNKAINRDTFDEDVMKIDTYE